MYITMVVEGVVVGRNNCSLIKDGDRPETDRTRRKSHGAQPKPRCSTKARECTDHGKGKPTNSGVLIGSVRKWISLSRVPMEILIFPIEPINKVCLYVLFIKRYLKNKLNLTLSRSWQVEQCWQVITVPRGSPYITMKFLMCRLMCTVEFAMSHV